MSSSDIDDDRDLHVSSATLASDFISPNVVNGQEMPDKILEQDNIKDEDPEEVEFIGFYKPAVQQPRSRHRNLLFSDREKGLILNNKMLTDESINIAMQILKRKFPETDALEDTTLGKVHQFSIFRNKFLQVLHDGGCHSVCVANFIGNNKCDRSAIHYYDSLNTTGAIKKFIEVQICSFLLCQEDQLTIVVKPVQQQGEINCGLFALAFATSLLF